MWKFAAAIVLLVVMFSIAILSDRPLPRADLVIINRGEVNTLDAQRMSWLQDLRASAMLFERLVEFDPFSTDFSVRPGVAEKWEISADKKTYTFHLRADAGWSNGKTVTADDFRRTWRRALLPDTAGDYIDFFRLIEGAREFYDYRQNALKNFDPAKGVTAAELYKQATEKFDEVVEMRAPDARTLVIKLVRPVPYFMDLCAFEALGPLYMDEVERFQTLDPLTGRIVMDLGWTKPGRMVGNGPFALSLWRFKREMRLERNPFYWNPKAISVDSVSMPSIDDASAVILSFQSGSIDWVSDVVADCKRDMLAAKAAFYAEHAEQVALLRAQGLDPVAIDRRLPKDARKNIHSFPTFGTYFFNFNCSARLPDGRPNPMADARVRRALALTVDKERVAALRGIGEPVAGALVPPRSIPGYVSPKGLARDVDEARRLLAEAGFKDGKGLPVIEILLSKDGGHELVAQSMASDWREQLGVSVTLAVKEVRVFSDDVKNNRFMISRAGWFGDYGDPTTFLDICRAGNGNNDRRFDDPRYNDLLRQADEETDPAKRLAILSEAERVLVEEQVPLLPLVHYQQVYLFDADRLSGISPHPRQKQLLYLADILGDGKGKDVPLEMPLRPTGDQLPAQGSK